LENRGSLHAGVFRQGVFHGKIRRHENLSGK